MVATWAGTAITSFGVHTSFLLLCFVLFCFSFTLLCFGGREVGTRVWESREKCSAFQSVSGSSESLVSEREERHVCVLGREKEAGDLNEGCDQMVLRRSLCVRQNKSVKSLRK